MRFPISESRAVRLLSLSVVAILSLVPLGSRAESLAVRSSTAWTGTQGHLIVVDFSTDGQSGGLAFELALDPGLQLSPMPPAVSIPNAIASCRSTGPGRIRCLVNAPASAVGLGTGTITLVCSVPQIAGNYPVTVVAANFYDQQAMPRTASIVGGLVTVQVQPTLSISNVATAEGNAGTKKAQFTIELAPVSAAPVSMRVSTRPGTATPGRDYVGLDAVLITIPAGAASAAVSVDVVGDAVAEANETFAVALHGVQGAAGEGANAKGTILDDDKPQLRIDDVTVKEGSQGTTTATFVVSLSNPAATPVTFDYTTVAGTALSGSDFEVTSRSGRLIDAGRSRVLVEVPVIGDSALENDEMFSVVVSGVAGADIVDGSATGTITDDDAPSVARVGIAAVQGVGPVSPMVGQVVEVRGMVTGTARSGYFLQSSQPDGNSLSSEGLFVSSAGDELHLGDLVRVRGTVSERYSASKGLQSSETQLLEITRVREGSGVPLPEAVQVSLPILAWQQPGALEHVEGMRISLDAMQVVGPTTARRDAAGDLQPTAVSQVVATGVSRTFDIGRGSPERLVLDAGYLGGPPISLNAGDHIGGLTVVVGVAEGHYALLVAAGELPRVAGNARPMPAPEAAADRAALAWMRIAGTSRSEDVGVALADASRVVRAVCTMASAPDVVVLSAERTVQYVDALEALLESDAPSLTGCAHGTRYRLAGQGASDPRRLILVKSINFGQPARSSHVTSAQAVGEQATYAEGRRRVRLFDRAPVWLGLRLAGPSGQSLSMDVLVVSLEPTSSGESGPSLRRRAQEAFVERLVRGRLASAPAAKVAVLGNYVLTPVNGRTHARTAAPSALGLGPGDLRNAGDGLPPNQRYTAVETGDAVMRDAILVSSAIADQLNPQIYPVRMNADFSEDLADEVDLPLRLSDQDPLVLQVDYQ